MPPRNARTRPGSASIRERLGRDRLFRTSPDLPAVVEIDVGAIAPNPEQPRRSVEPDELVQLQTSIERHGLLQPILVRATGAGTWELVAGQRRLEAVRALGRETIAALPVKGDPGELALVENLQRHDLDPFDEAAALARLIERHGYSQAELGAVIGRPQSSVAGVLALNRLPQATREAAVAAGAGRSVLIELAQADPATQAAMAARLRNGPATVRELRAAKTERAVSVKATAAPAPYDRLLGSSERLIGTIQARVGEGSPPEPDVIERLKALHAALGALLDGLAPLPRRVGGRRRG